MLMRMVSQNIICANSKRVGFGRNKIDILTVYYLHESIKWILLNAISRNLRENVQVKKYALNSQKISVVALINENKFN